MARAASSASSAGKPGAGYATSRLFAFCLVFRVANAFAVRTYFNADEFWQGPEVAHRVVFGYGHLTWEWQRWPRHYPSVKPCPCCNFRAIRSETPARKL